MIGRKSDTKKAADMPQEWADMRESTGEKAGTATIHRKNPQGRDSHLDTVPVGEIGRDPHVYIKRRFGGGEFKVYLRDTDGAFMKSTTVDVTIDGPPKAPEVPAAETRADDSSGMMVAMLHEGREDRRADRADQLAREAAALASRVDPVAVVQAIVAAAAPIVTAILARESAPVVPPPTMLEQVETMTAMMGLAKQMSGGDDDSGFGGLVKTLAEPIAALAKGVTNPPAEPPAPGPAPAPQPQGPPVERPDWFPIFEPVIPQLLGWARAGKDATLRAEYVLDELPAHMIDPVYHFLTAEGFSAEFFATVQPAAEFREWFGAFFDSMLAGIALDVPAELVAGDDRASEEEATPDDAAGFVAEEAETE